MADMVLIKRPYASPLYFTKPGVHWEYATVAGESARAFVYFTEAGKEGELDGLLSMQTTGCGETFIYSVREEAQSQEEEASPSKGSVCAGIVKQICMRNHSVDS